MKKLKSIINKFLPNPLKSSIDLGLVRRNYGHFRLILFVIMLIITTVPATTIAILGYSNYKSLLQKDERIQLKWQLDGSVRAIEQMVENLKSVVQFAARRDRYKELTMDSNLKNLFDRLHRQYPFFADLGVIDQNGIQQTYYGPYGLQGTDYSGESWLKAVFNQGLHISRVYKGYRNVPHFAIAVGNYDPATRQTWVLRATIDAITLQQFVDTIKTNASDDLFLIDNKGVLQTQSDYYGQALERSDIETKVGIWLDTSPAEKAILHGTGNIRTTPWSLVIMKKGYITQNAWKSFRLKLLLIYFTCTGVSVVIIYSLVTLLTSLIRKADEIQITMMQEAEHKDKLASIGRLAAGVAHEINNPLAIINQKTGLIEDLLQISGDFDEKDTVQHNLKSIDASVERCKIITHRLLGFARRTDILHEQMNINVVIREVLQFLENTMLYNRITLDLQLHDNLPPIFSDRVQLQQIFLNIINNAMDAIGKDGTVSIITSMVAGEVRVVIQDDGAGIAQDLLPYIFGPFFTTKETGKGTGLGLSITYGLIKKMGGDITVRSNVGKGTAFTITLPMDSEQT